MIGAEEKREVNVLDEKRKGEIAYKLLLYKASRDGIRIGPNSKRDLGNVAKDTGIPLEELKEFVREAIKELTDETLS